MTVPDDMQLVEEHLVEELGRIVPGMLRGNRGRSLGMDLETEEMVAGEWVRLLSNPTGPGRELVDQMVDYWARVTLTERRRNAVMNRLYKLVPEADGRRLETLEQMLDLLDAAPPILTAEQDEAVLAAHQDEVELPPLVDDLPRETDQDPPPRRRVDCWRCGAEIRWEASSDDTPGRGWVHVSSDSVRCYLNGEGNPTLTATPHDPAHDKEPF